MGARCELLHSLLVLRTNKHSLQIIVFSDTPANVATAETKKNSGLKVDDMKKISPLV